MAKRRAKTRKTSTRGKKKTGSILEGPGEDWDDIEFEGGSPFKAWFPAAWDVVPDPRSETKSGSGYYTKLDATLNAGYKEYKKTQVHVRGEMNGNPPPRTHKRSRSCKIEFYYLGKKYKAWVKLDKKVVELESKAPLKLDSDGWWKTSLDPVFIRDIWVSKKGNPFDPHDHPSHDRITATWKS